MALENYIIGASNTGAAGYHNAMAGMDQRKREAEVDRHNAFNRMNVDRQYKDTKMREAFEMAALMDVDETNNGPALDYLDRVSDELGVQRPERSQIGPALKTYRAQIGNNLPSGVQEMQWITQQGKFTPQEMADYLRIEAGLKARAGQRLVRAPDGSVYLSEGNDGLTPLVTPQQAIEGAGLKAGTEQAARESAITAEIPSRTEAEIQSEMDKSSSARQQAAGFDLPSIESKANQTLAVIDGLLNSKGFDKIFGAASYVPIVRGSDRADAFAYLSQIQGRAFLEAFETLKGGGQITQIEGEKATAAIARLEQAQSPEAARGALAELKGIITSAVERARKSAGVSRGTTPAESTSGPAPTKSIDDLVNQYAPRP